MLLQFGTTSEAVRKTWQALTINNSKVFDLLSNPRLKSFVHVSEGFHRQQLHSWERLNNLQKVLVRQIDKA